jgi:hypothetical protein
MYRKNENANQPVTHALRALRAANFTDAARDNQRSRRPSLEIPSGLSRG